MEYPAAGLNALIAQCRKLEAALPGQDEPSGSAAMHRFVDAMDARRTPPGMWSPLVLAVLVMSGGLGVAFILCAWVLLPGVSGWPVELIPTGQAKLGLLAIAKDATGVFMALLKLGLIGILLAVVGIAGTGRR